MPLTQRTPAVNWEEYRRLVGWVAGQLRHLAERKGLSLDDLVAVGLEVSWQASLSYDPEKGIAFSTWSQVLPSFIQVRKSFIQVRKSFSLV